MKMPVEGIEQGEETRDHDEKCYQTERKQLSLTTSSLG